MACAVVALSPLARSSKRRVRRSTLVLRRSEDNTCMSTVIVLLGLAGGVERLSDGQWGEECENWLV